MKTISLSLLCLAIILFTGCSENNEDNSKKSEFSQEQLMGSWVVKNILDNGLIRNENSHCDNPQTVTISETRFITYMIDDDNCRFETRNWLYDLDGDIITISGISNLVIRLRILKLDTDILRFKFFFSSQEGGNFDGEIWELKK